MYCSHDRLHPQHPVLLSCFPQSRDNKYSISLVRFNAANRPMFKPIALVSRHSPCTCLSARCLKPGHLSNMGLHPSKDYRLHYLWVPTGINEPWNGGIGESQTDKRIEGTGPKRIHGSIMSVTGSGIMRHSHETTHKDSASYNKDSPRQKE